ncbi:hypothetical protein FHW36_10672 [Chitinophaga polysaccharea]|uniref:Uncharacterized protein n=1 Tax=Chitinophaga polysaccharea TaxID=1293035 RepID=A0A561PL64_9BACT|nr:hypothetical protein [Chitinophaga polysaccharea]TWF38849.1 hypothetical protein FHW36_10672 [Chitinophaga polysaccharea]
MADKKIIQLNPASTITANDILGVCQNPITGELLQATASDLRTYVLGGANAGARIFFIVGIPSIPLGVDGDVCFDIQAHNIYQKASGAWILQDSYGSIGGMDRIRFTATYGSGGLSADGKSYINSSLLNGMPQEVLIDGSPLIGVENFGDIPAFDEWDFDPVLGKLIFGSPLPAGARITVLYSF